jgi:hypothetical protein
MFRPQFPRGIDAADVGASVWGVDRGEREPEPDVDAHLRALDDEIARLRKLEAAMDRRIEEADEERRSFEEATRRAADPPPEG